MSGYVAIVAARFRTLLQYRAAALAGLVTQVFFGLVRIMILQAFYAGTAAGAPMDAAQIVGYVWLGQAMLKLLPWQTDGDVAQQIRDGSVVYELTKPLDLYAVWYARALASRTAPLLLRMLPMFGFAMVVLPLLGADAWRLAPPVSPAAGAMFACTFVGAVLLSAALMTVMTASLLWTVSSDGVPMLVGAFATMFGGLVIPLPLFPDWAQGLLYAMPFCGLLDMPSRVYTGSIAPGDAVWVVAHQLAWTAVLVASTRALVGRGLRRLVVQGG